MDEAQEKASGAEKPDWARVAGHALDLWQAHLSSLASDPKAKEDMAKLIAPMGQAFADWAAMMQQGMESFATCAATPQPKTQTQTEEASSPANTSSDDGVSFAPVHAESVEPDAGPRSSDESHDGEQPVPVAAQPEPVSEPVVESVPKPAFRVEPSSQPQSSPESGRAASADSPRDLAQLAGRLAELERELDALRAKSRKRAEADSLAADGEAGRVVGTHSGATSG